MQAWIADELRTVDLGDQRLDWRYHLLLDRLSTRPTASIPAACQGRAETEAAYRFFDNPRVLPDGVLAPHRGATLQRLRQHPVALLVQDTTELDLTRSHEVVGGPLNEESRRGFYAHPLVAFTPGRVPLGTVHAALWARDVADFPKGRLNKDKPIDAKESFRWLEGYRQACAVAAAAPETTVVCLSDSEGDVYECFLAAAAAAAGSRPARWVVRACQDRRLREGEASKLYAAVAAARRLGRLEVEVRSRQAQAHDERKRKQARRGRTATVTVRAARVCLQAPARKGERLPPVWVNAILVREDRPPPGEERLEWLLLTDLPVGTFTEVQQAIAFYCCRWGAEIFFRVLKGGCRVEGRQLETDGRYLACLALYLVVAWRVLYVLMLGRESPEMPCDAVFSEDEWQSVYTILKGTPAAGVPTLGEMIELIARLGGYLGRKHDGPPGPQVMWLGLQRMRDFAAAWCSFGPGQKKRRPKSHICVER
jgi:Transposase DNA-binding/Transposase Tn5 dimerisation domain